MTSDVLKKENIILNCTEEPKETIIRRMGELLISGGYVGEGYIDAMLKREEVFSTNIGNGIAMPHGIEEAKKEIKRSGIGIMVFPDGTVWNEERVKVVIGVAGAGDEHLDILARIAEVLCEQATVERLTCSGRDAIYEMFVE